MYILQLCNNMSIIYYNQPPVVSHIIYLPNTFVVHNNSVSRCCPNFPELPIVPPPGPPGPKVAGALTAWAAPRSCLGPSVCGPSAMALCGPSTWADSCSLPGPSPWAHG